MRNCASGNLEIPGSMRSLSSGAHSRDPLASPRNDGANDYAVRSNNCRISVVIRPVGDAISFMIEK
jgi:hypothetical protein